MTGSFTSNRRILLAAFLLTGLEGLALLWLMLRSPSAAENTILAGLSAPRLALAGVLLAGSVGAGGLGLAVGCVPGWGRVLSAWLDRLAGCPDRLLAASFLLLVIGLAAAALAGGLLAAGALRVLERIAPLCLWTSLAAFQSLLALWWTYRDAYRRPGFFQQAPQKIARVLVGELAPGWIGAGLLAIAAGTLFAASSISSGHGRVLGHDSGIFLYFGQQILRGDLPFRDLWDHKPPLIFYLDALGLWTGRGSLWGVWTLELWSLAAAGLLGYRALRGRFPRWAAFLAMGASLAHAVFFLEGGNLTEEFALPLQWAALTLAFTRPRRWGWLPRAVLCGALFAVALSLKQTMVGIWVALAASLALDWLFTRRAGLGKGALYVAGGALMVVLALAGYFAAHGALGDFWSVAYEYNFRYSEITTGRRLQALAEMLSLLAQSSPYFILALATWLAGAGYVVWMVRRAGFRALFAGQPVHFPLLVALLNLPIEFLLINTSGKNYRHYFLSLLPGLSVLIAWGLAGLGQIVRRAVQAHRTARRWLVRVGQLVAIGLLLAILFYSPYRHARVLLTTPWSDLATTATVKYIQAQTQAQDYVLMWGSQTTINFLSGRRSPTRFVHQKALFRPGYARAAFSDEMLRDLREKRPVLIIDTHLPSTPFVEAAPDGSCHAPDRPLPEGIDAVFAYVCAHYRLETTLTQDHWEVYRRID